MEIQLKKAFLCEVQIIKKKILGIIQINLYLLSCNKNQKNLNLKIAIIQKAINNNVVHF